MLKNALERALLVCAGIGLALVVGEVGASVGYWAVQGQRFPTQDCHRAMLEQSTAPKDQPLTAHAGEFSREFIHPYLGFVPDPTRMRDGMTIGDPGQVVAPSDRELIVGLFGGSFGGGLCNYANAELRRVLARPGKAVRLLCIAAAGYKQPQQLLALTYLLAQGAHFDLVINVDGFNEVALAPLENTPQGVAPIYPRAWLWRVGTLQDPGALKLVAQLSSIENARREWSEWFVDWGLYRSTLLALVWQSRDRLLRAAWTRSLTELNDHRLEQRKSYAGSGPAMTFADDAALYTYLARVWKDSSLQMKLLCDANGIAYEHFLQPNQYVKDSKPMGQEEQRVAIGGGPYPTAVAGGYPRLEHQGEELRRAGVRFHDLTIIFKDVQDPVYRDNCCHLNGAGYAMVARAIGDSIGRETPGLPDESSVQPSAHQTDPP